MKKYGKKSAEVKTEKITQHAELTQIPLKQNFHFKLAVALLKEVIYNAKVDGKKVGQVGHGISTALVLLSEMLLSEMSSWQLWKQELVQIRQSAQNFV